MGQVEGDYTPQSVGEKLGIHFSPSASSIVGKQLQPPELQLGQRERIEEHKSTSFMLFNKPIYSREHSLRICLFYPGDFDLAPTKRLLESTCRGLGLQF